MEFSIIESLSGLGVGGILALIIFVFYRKATERYERQLREDREQLREDRKFMEDRLTGIIEADQETLKEHTVATTELITYLKLKNGNKSRH